MNDFALQERFRERARAEEKCEKEQWSESGEEKGRNLFEFFWRPPGEQAYYRNG